MCHHYFSPDVYKKKSSYEKAVDKVDRLNHLDTRRKKAAAVAKERNKQVVEEEVLGR